MDQLQNDASVLASHVDVHAVAELIEAALFAAHLERIPYPSPETIAARKSGNIAAVEQILRKALAGGDASDTDRKLARAVEALQKINAASSVFAPSIATEALSEIAAAPVAEGSSASPCFGMSAVASRCQCEHPMIRCDHRGCRCELCGLPEDMFRDAKIESRQVQRPKTEEPKDTGPTVLQMQILREIAGELPPSPWGAWVGECLGTLFNSGYITAKFGGKLTDKGREVLRVCPKPVKEGE